MMCVDKALSHLQEDMNIIAERRWRTKPQMYTTLLRLILNVPVVVMGDPLHDVKYAAWCRADGAVPTVTSVSVHISCVKAFPRNQERIKPLWERISTIQNNIRQFLNVQVCETDESLSTALRPSSCTLALELQSCGTSPRTPNSLLSSKQVAYLQVTPKQSYTHFMCTSFYWERTRSPHDGYSKSCARDWKRRLPHKRQMFTKEIRTSKKHAKCYCAFSIPIQPELFRWTNLRPFQKTIHPLLSFFYVFSELWPSFSKHRGSSNDKVIHQHKIFCPNGRKKGEP